MRFLKPALTILLALFLSASIPVSAGAQPDTPDWSTLTTSSGELSDSAVEALAAILIDANSGQVLYEKQADVKKYPASITKIMTCLLTLENCNLNDIVTIGNLGEFEKGATKIGIQEGDSISIEELLYGLMLPSGNDAAVALAQYISGSVEEFANLMNEKCTQLGMANTHFVNPHGLHDDNHYTTARDMAKLAMEARKYSEFVKIVSTAYHTVTNADVDFEGINEWENSNRLILPNNEYAYEFATGVKTGYTSAAQHTLVASSKKDDFELITVVLEDTKLGKWTDATTMLLYGYEYYDTINLVELLAKDPIYTDVENAANGQLEIIMVADSESYYTDKKNTIAELKTNPDRFQMQTNYGIAMVAPIAKDSLIGTAAFSLDGEVLMTCKLYAANTIQAVPENTPESLPVSPAPGTGATPEGSLFGLTQAERYILVGLIALLVLILVIVVINRNTKHKMSSKAMKHSKRYSPPNNNRRRH